MSQNKNLELIKEANKLLSKKGFRKDGRPKGDVDGNQFYFEKGIKHNAMGNRIR